MKDAILERARVLGFDRCRVTHAAAPARADYFRSWLARGWHGAMGYLGRTADKRCDPGLVLPGVRSVLALAASYHAPTAGGAAAEPAGTGRVARYAQRPDYHDVLKAPLGELCAFIDSLGGGRTRSLGFVDTGPILERELAERAGLGFVGKHTNLIGRDLGNWFVVAQILTTAEIEPDPPETNHCGHCRRCLDACPTGAIVAPFQLDARRCIAYLTIEWKGSIPVEFRPAIGRRIFGCDDCLEVCPWNRFAREGRLLRPPSRPDLATPDLLELLRLDDAGFKRRFADTPLLRSKRRGLLRNVAVALGNTGDPTALPALARATSDSEPLIAEHAQWALATLERRHPALPSP